jgi:penicillin amidase
VEFSEELVAAVLSPIVARCREVDPSFELDWAELDDPVQRIIESQRPELLPDRKNYQDWSGFIRAVLMQSAQRLVKRYGVQSVDGLSWGTVTMVEMTHPLSGGLPWIWRFLDMPRLPLAGCIQCVRYANGNTGATARMVVAPGHEVDGILQMAGGQSGQPGSRHYADQQASWVTGRPIPFLGGEKQHRITLQPSP